MSYTNGAGVTFEPGFRVNNDSPRVPGIGGPAIALLAGETVAIGDAVYLYSAGVVKKGATANKAAFIGVVVSGASCRFRAQPEVANGTTAAVSGETVIVAVAGATCYARANAAILMAARLIFGATAGRLDTAAATTASAANPTQASTTATQANSTVPAGATPVTSSAANGAIITAGVITVTNGAITAGAVTVAGDGFHNIIGIALAAAAANGDYFKVLLT